MQKEIIIFSKLRDFRLKSGIKLYCFINKLISLNKIDMSTYENALDNLSSIF